MTPTRLLLIAQSPVLRFGIQALVQSNWTLYEIAGVENSLDAFRAAPDVQPDVAIIQDALPGVTGMIAARMIRQLSPAARIIVLADDVELAARAAGGTAGIDAMLPSAIEPDDLINAIRGFESRAVSGVIPFESASPSAIDIAVLDGVARGISIESIGESTGATRAEALIRAEGLLNLLQAPDPGSLIAHAARRGWIDPRAQSPGGSQAISFAVAA